MASREEPLCKALADAEARVAKLDDERVKIAEDFQPIPDQWVYLAFFVRMTPENVELSVEEATQGGQVIGVGISSNKEEHKPWEAPPPQKKS